MLRRPRASTAGPADAEPITIGELTLDTVARIVTVDGVAVELTRTEFDLLALLAIRPRAVVTRRQLIEDVWGTDWYGDDHVVDVHIGHLRSKLGDDATDPRYVRTVRGVGYGMGTG